METNKDIEQLLLSIQKAFDVLVEKRTDLHSFIAMIVVLLTHPERDMHSVLYAFPFRVIFYGSSRNSMISATCCRV